MKYKKYPTEALLELLFMVGEQHQSNMSVINNSWAHKEHSMIVALGKNNDNKKALIKEILSRSEKNDNPKKWLKMMTNKEIKSRINKLKQSNALLSHAEIIVLMSELNLRGEYV